MTIKVGWRVVKFSIYEYAIVSRTEKFLGKLVVSPFLFESRRLSVAVMCKAALAEV